MTTRSRRFMFQASGAALAAVIATSVPANSHRPIAAAQAGDLATLTATLNAGSAPALQQDQVSLSKIIVTDSSEPNLLHHWPAN